MNEHQQRLNTIASFADDEARGLLDRVHNEDTLTLGELTDLAYTLQGLATFARAGDIEPQSLRVPPKLTVINGGAHD